MKYSYWSVLTMILVLGAIQQLQAQDTILVENFYRHEIKEGKPMRNKKAVYQNTYNLNRQLIQRIDYCDTGSSACTYTYYFYTNFDSLLSVERYDANNQLRSIKRIDYNANKQPVKLKMYGTTDNHMALTEYTIRRYANGKISETASYNAKAKRTGKSKYAYESGITTLTEAYTKNHPSGIKNRVTTWKESTPYIIHKTVTTIHRDKSRTHEKFEIVKDTLSGRVTEIVAFTGSGDISKRTQLLYKKDGSLKISKNLNPDGSYLDNYSVMYFQHVVVLGKREMYRLPE